MNRILNLTAIAFAVAGISSSALAQPRNHDSSSSWAQVPAILQRIVPPTMPSREFVITNYGGVPGGTVNVVMRNCTSHRGHGGLVIGSEMSGSVSNVFMEDCEFEGTDRAIRLKSRADRGGVVEHVYARNLKVKNMQREVIILNMDYGSDRSAILKHTPPVFRNMRFENITGDGAPTAILIQGMAGSPIQDIEFANMSIRSTKGVVAHQARDLRFENVNVTPAKGPVFDLENVNGVTILKSTAPADTEVFLKAEGNSGGIQVKDCDLAGARIPFAAGKDVAPGGIVIEK